MNVEVGRSVARRRDANLDHNYEQSKKLEAEEGVHFCTWKNCRATPSASAYFWLMAPGGPGTGSTSRWWCFFLIANTAAATTNAAITSTISHPEQPLVYFDSPILRPPLVYLKSTPTAGDHAMVRRSQPAEAGSRWNLDLGFRRQCGQIQEAGVRRDLESTSR